MERDAHCTCLCTHRKECQVKTEAGIKVMSPLAKKTRIARHHQKLEVAKEYSPLEP